MPVTFLYFISFAILWLASGKEPVSGGWLFGASFIFDVLLWILLIKKLLE